MTRAWGLLAILFALMPHAYGQEIWRHVDARGQSRYADRPFPGAIRMELPDAARWHGQREASARQRQPSQGETPAFAAAAPSPPTLEIARPKSGETVWGVGGELEVRLTVGGNREDGDRLSLRLDGAEASWRGEPPVLRLAGVWRGEHRLQARLLDPGGRERAASKEILFFKREPAVSPTPAR